MSWENRHISRSFRGAGAPLEAACPCPKAPCGYVIWAALSPDCTQHTVDKTIRDGHAADDCPGAPA